MKICICNTLRTHFKDSLNTPLEMPVHISILITYLKYGKENTQVVCTRLKTRWI